MGGDRQRMMGVEWRCDLSSGTRGECNGRRENMGMRSGKKKGSVGSLLALVNFYPSAVDRRGHIPPPRINSHYIWVLAFHQGLREISQALVTL